METKMSNFVVSIEHGWSPWILQRQGDFQTGFLPGLKGTLKLLAGRVADEELQSSGWGNGQRNSTAAGFA